MPPRPAPWIQGRQFGIVIDAGSSGSRVQIYSWIDPQIARQSRKAEKKSLEVLSRVEKGVEQGEGWHMKAEPGISTFGEKPEDVAAYLKPLIEFATSVVPSNQLSSTPIYLLATAGMRLLPQAQQRSVLDATCSYLQTFPFKIEDCDQNVRIITGEEEGLYGWIAVNYLMDGFDKHEHRTQGDHSHSSTYGFLDMGGASTQIAFEPAEKEQINHRDNLLDVNLMLLSGRTVSHPVFVTTWLGFGTNQARNRYIDAAIQAHLKSTSDEAHPTEKLDSAGLGSERPMIVVEDPCLPKSLLLTETRHSGYTLKGTGDFPLCVKKTGPLLNKEVECLDQPCLFNGVHVPPIDFSVNHFIGISEYWYSTHEIWGMGGMYDYVAFEKNAIEYCGKEWDEIMEDHKSGKKWKAGVELSRLETQCFKAAWVVNILHEGIGIPRIIDQGGHGDGKNVTDKAINKGIDKGLVPAKPSFQSLSEVGDVAISWTLGKMVLEVARGSTQAPTINPKRPFAIDWSSTRIPSWANGDVKSTIAGIKDDPTPALGVSVVLVALWYFYCMRKTGSSRKRSSFLGSFMSAKRKSDFNLLPNDDSGFSSSDSSNGASGSGSRSPNSKRSKTSSFASKLWYPIRYPILRLTSIARNLGRSRNGNNGSLLPMTRSNGNAHDLRPRAIRQAKSVPFLRNSAAPNATPATSAQNGHWNDIPDRNASIPMSNASLMVDSTSSGTISRSHSANFLSGRVHTSSPPPLTIIIPPSPLATPAPATPPNGIIPASRPTTPSSRNHAANPLSRLTARNSTSYRGGSDDFTMKDGMITPSAISPNRNRFFVTSGNDAYSATATPPSGPGLTNGAIAPSNQNLANAVWESFGTGRLSATPTEEHGGFVGVGASSWNGSIGGVAKLRANSKSQNNSQVNLNGLTSGNGGGRRSKDSLE